MIEYIAVAVISFAAGVAAHRWIVREDLKLAVITKAMVAGRIAALKVAVAPAEAKAAAVVAEAKADVAKVEAKK